MKNSDIADAASALGNQVDAGIPLVTAVGRMSLLQPEYADFWADARTQLASGGLLSKQLQDEWPPAMLAALQAGEQSGKIVEVFAQIEANIALEREITDSVFKLAYPVGMALAGVVVFIGFMVFVLPTTGKAFGTSEAGAIYKLSNWMASMAKDHGILILGGIAAGIFAFATWVRTPEARLTLLDMALNLPVLGQALTLMYFGLWAKYLGLCAAAGLPTPVAIKSTRGVLPGVLRESVDAFEEDLTLRNKMMSVAASTTDLPADDPRTIWWPFYLSNAFIVAEQTGSIDREMYRASPVLIRDGQRQMDRALWVLNLVALVCAAVMIVMPLGAYYMQAFEPLQRMGR